MPQGKKVQITSKLVKPVVHARHVSMNTTNARCGLGLESAKLIQDVRPDNCTYFIDGIPRQLFVVLKPILS